MGEVYRATDTNLKRDVAIKFLPEAFTQDPERLARFQREAELLAQLQHPNIASIYGLEGSGGNRALVMELVEGPTLAEHMEQGPLPLEDALTIARQIAEALEEAHAKGIVHRDLKPANVKLTTDGRVKVLDFGLAKALDPTTDISGAQATLSHSPTVTAGTQLGVILGTASYMSPEQARGVPTDKRTDIWAFGVVLYEMLTGVRLFEGEMVSDVLAEVLKSRIDFETLPADAPAAIRRLLKRCLERKPKDRLHDIADARIVINEILSGEVEEDRAEVDTAATNPRRGSLLPWLIAGAAIVALIVTLLLSTGGGKTGERGAYALSLSPPAGMQFMVGSNAGWGAVSPDGRRIVARVSGPEGSGLWLRSLDGGESRLLPGTEEGFYPFWSPDNRWVLFFSRGSLQRVEIAGGLPERVCAAPWGRGGSWSAESGRILLTPVGAGAIHVVPAGGGETRPITRVDLAAGESAHYWPVWLPDGKRFLYFIRASGRENQGIFLGHVPEEGIDEERRRVVASSSSGLLVPAGSDGASMLLWVEDGVLLARSFDLESGTISGATSRIAEGVRVLESQRASLVSASDEGTLSWASSRFGRFTLGWFDRKGKGPDLVDMPELNIYQPLTSPDGRWVSFVVVHQGQGDIWLYDTVSGETRALTSTTSYEESVAWSPDSTEIAFSLRTDDASVVRMRVDGSEEPSVVIGAKLNKLHVDSPEAWLPNDWLIVEVQEPDGTSDLYAVHMDDTSDAQRLIGGPGSQLEARVSPDGRSLIYLSDETGSAQSYLVSLVYADGRPVAGTDRRRIPVDDVLSHTWSVEGDEAYTVTSEGTLFAVPMDTRGGFARPGTPVALFQVPPARATISFGVAPKGERFLFQIDPEAKYQTLSVMLDWETRLD